MGDTNSEKRNAAQLNERNDQFDSVENKSENNELVDNSSRPQPRPIPDVFPRFPYDIGGINGNVKPSYTENSGPGEMRNKSNYNSKDIYHNVGMVEQGLQLGGNIIQSSGVSNVQSCPYVLTLLPPSVTSQNLNSQARVHPVATFSSGHYVQNPHSSSPYVRVPIVDPMYYQNQRTYQYGYRVQTPVRTHDNIYWSHQQLYRSKPGSVYGIPPEPRIVQNDYHRIRGPYNLFLQPNTIRVFNDYRSNYQRQESNEIVQNSSPNNNRSPKQSRHVSTGMDPKNEITRDKGTVHIGGLLTLPRGVQTNTDESSQSSSGSNQKDEESTKVAFTLPGMTLFKKCAIGGCKDLEKLISKYNVKSSRVDLEEFCRSVRCSLASTNPGMIQMEPVIREMILAFLHITSSWLSLAGVLPITREQPNLLDSSLEPLAKEFNQWQEVSKTMLEKIITALRGIPSEHERFVSGAYKKSPNKEFPAGPVESENFNSPLENWTVYESPIFPKQQIERGREQSTNSLGGPRQNMRNPQSYNYNYPYSTDNSNQSDFHNEMHKVHMSPNMPLIPRDANVELGEWDNSYGPTIIYPQQYENKKPQEANIIGKRFPQNGNESLNKINDRVPKNWNEGK